MPNGNDVVAVTHDGVEHHFPSGTPDAVVDAAIKGYLNPPKDPYGFATTGTGGGPESEMLRRHARSRAGKDFGPEPGVVPWLLRQGGGALEATGELAKAVPDMLKTVGTVLTGTPGESMRAGQSLVQPQVEQWKKGGTTTGVESLARRGAALIPFAGPMAAEAGESFGRGEVGRGAVQTAAAIEARPRFGGGGEGMPAAQELMGEGKFKARSLQYQHANALATKEHLSDVADAVHTDAQQAMARVSQTVDAAKPEGVFDKGEVGDRLKGAMGDILSDPSQLPKSLQKLMPKEVEGKQVGPSIGGKALDLSKPEDMTAYQRYKASGAFTPEEIARYEGKATGKMSFEDLKQARSDLARQMDALKGPAEAAAKAAYGELSKMLREAARDGGVESDWLTGNNKYKQYMNDFENKGAPLKKVLSGATASDIMEPLYGKLRQRVLDIMDKYKSAGFNVDTDWLNKQIGRYGAAKKTLKMAEPGKWDLILAGLSPKIAAVRQGIPRLAGAPKTLDVVFGKGAEMPARQVYPSKAAAMKARKP